MRTLTDMFNRRMIVGLGIVLVAALAGGCKTDSIAGPERTKVAGPTTDLETPAGINVPNIQVAGRTELDLVEEMILHRTMYARLLRALANYYNENGNATKEAWARTELNDLKYVKPYRYIADAEAPAAELKPTESIAEGRQAVQRRPGTHEERRIRSPRPVQPSDHEAGSGQVQ